MNNTNAALWSIDKITPYAQNAKVHEDKQVDKIAASIRKFGWRGNPIVVDENGEILAGHGRRLAALKLGLKQVPVEQVTGMSADEKRAYRLADNRVAVSHLDGDILAKELAEMKFDLGDIFDKKELAFLEVDLGEINDGAFIEDLDAAIEVQAVETQKALAEADEKPVAIAKALGFKAIPGKFERVVAMWMARVEEETGKSGAEAFVAFAEANA